MEKETFESLQDKFIDLYKQKNKIVEEQWEREYMKLRAEVYDNMCNILDDNNNFITRQ